MSSDIWEAWIECLIHTGKKLMTNIEICKCCDIIYTAPILLQQYYNTIRYTVGWIRSPIHNYTPEVRYDRKHSTGYASLGFQKTSPLKDSDGIFTLNINYFQENSFLRYTTHLFFFSFFFPQYWRLNPGNSILSYISTFLLF